MPLHFLIRLQHLKLPLHVNSSAEIRLVSALKATGMIEATFHMPRSAMAGVYVVPESASVHCITDAGMRELQDFLAPTSPRPVAA